MNLATMRRKQALFLILALAVFFFSCQKKSVPGEKRPAQEKTSPGILLRFSLTIDKNTYLYSDYGEPPQMAIWLENPDGKFYQTVFVTHRVGANDWVGKVDCPVALPFWESRQFAWKRRPDETRQVEAVTGATPKGGVFRTSVRVPPGSRWRYFVEVNVAGDFNEAFPYWSKDGAPDDVGNGQPSLVYSGQILARPGEKGTPELLGFTDQFSPTDTLRMDWGQITTAKNLISQIVVEAVTE